MTNPQGRGAFSSIDFLQELCMGAQLVPGNTTGHRAVVDPSHHEDTEEESFRMFKIAQAGTDPMLPGGSTLLSPLHDRVNADLVPAALERGLQPHVGDHLGQLVTDDARTHAQHVRVVVQA